MDINELFFLGLNKYGQAGIGEKYHNRLFNTPKSFAFSVFIKQISCGAHHSALLTIEGNIYTMGSNIHGALGSNPTLNYSFVPTLVEGLDEVTKIESGPFHMCAISGGQLYSWGKGIDGQLGHGNTKNQSRPIKIQSLGKEVQKVSCGTNHTLVLVGNSKRDSTKVAYSFGNGIYGQLGTGQSRNSYVPMRVKLQNVQLIAAGQNHSLFVSDGKIYSCGDNTNGQLGSFFSKKFIIEPTNLQLPKNQQKVIAIQAKKYSLALTESGGMYVWGTKVNSGPLLVQNMEREQRNVIDIRVGSDQIYGLTTSGSLYSWQVNKGIEKEGVLMAKQQAVISNNRAILDFSVGDGFFLVLGDIVKQISYSSVPTTVLSYFDQLSETLRSQPDSYSFKSQNDSHKAKQESRKSQFYNQQKEPSNAQTKNQVYASVEQIDEQNSSVYQQPNDENNHDFFKLKTGYNFQKKLNNKSQMKQGLLQNFDFNNLMDWKRQIFNNKQKIDQKSQNVQKKSTIQPIKAKPQEEAQEEGLEFVKTPSSSILCQPTNFLKESISRDNYQNRKATIHQSVSDRSQPISQPTPLEPMRKKKYSYSYLHTQNQTLQPSVSSKDLKEQRQQHRHRKIDQIMQMLQKSNSLGHRQSVEQYQDSKVQQNAKESQILKSNRLLRIELRDKELKISQLQQLLSRKEMQIETQRQLIKLLRTKNSSNFASVENN